MAIENDIGATQAEHENQNGILQAQQSALEVVITSIQELRLMGKQDADVTETSRPGTPLLSSQADNDVDMEPRIRAETGELPDDQLEVLDAKGIAGSTSKNRLLNPSARIFLPQSSSPSTPLLRSLAGTPLPNVENQPRKELEEGEDEDIEMGELAEEPIEKVEKVKKKARAEELEEGEASDMSSELSEPPDD
jgi:THO complex subunit 7